MIFKRIVFSVISIFFICLCLISFFENTANANDTKILKADVIKQGAIEFLAETLPWEKDSVEISVYYDGGDITIPRGVKKLIYKARANNTNAGRIPLILKIIVNDTFQKVIRINSRVLVSQEVVKTIRQVKKGERLSNENIELISIQTERPLKDAMQKIDYALGYEASRTLPTGKILTHRLIKKPALGNKGDKILILAEKGGMKITAPGILKDDAFEDGMVQVLNIESKKTIYGRLVDANTVKVSF